MRFIFLIISFFIFTLNSSFALDVVYPSSKEFTVNAASIYFYGNTNPKSMLRINSESVKLFDDGVFVQVVPLFYGANDKDTIYSFQLENSNFTVEYLDKITNSLYNEDYLTKKDKYSYFLDNNHPFIKITNHNVNNGEELLIIKDSYANSFIPILANHYEKIHVIDPRYYNMPITDYIKDNDIKNVLLLYNVNSIDTDQGVITIR